MTPGESTDLTLSALLREHAERQPHAIAILAPGRPPLTYGDLWRQVQRIANTLQSRGVTPTARVAVVLPNGPEMAATVLGVAACAVCAPLNPAYRLEEFRFYLQDTRAQFVVVGDNDVVILKSISAPSMDEFDSLISVARRQAKTAGLKPAHVEEAIARVRGRK